MFFFIMLLIHRISLIYIGDKRKQVSLLLVNFLLASLTLVSHSFEQRWHFIGGIVVEFVDSRVIGFFFSYVFVDIFTMF